MAGWILVRPLVASGTLLETQPPLAPGVASAGTALTASRGDHVHPKQVVAHDEVTGLQQQLDGKQAAGTYATLVNGLVPSSQLPSFVDDVLEFTNAEAFPQTGESGKLYVAANSGGEPSVFRWGGTTYVQVAASPGSTDSVAEGVTNRYFTEARAVSAVASTLAGYVSTTDSRLSDSRTALAHKASHATGGADALSPADIGAAAAGHSHLISSVTQLQESLDAKATVVHSHEISEINGLADALAAVASPLAIDGGDFVGVSVSSGSQITITQQPQNIATTIGQVFSQSSSLPSGEWNRDFAYVNDRYMVVASDASGGDYYATSTDGVNWTKRYGLNRAGLWRQPLYGNGKYAITNGTHVQISTNGLSWTESQLPGDLRFANGKWFRYVNGNAGTSAGWDQSGLYTSDDLVTWSSRIPLVKSFPAGTARASGSLTTAAINYRPTNISSVVYFAGKWLAFSDDLGTPSTFTSGGQTYFAGFAWVWSSTDAASWEAVSSIGGDVAFWTNHWATASSGSSSSASAQKLFSRPLVVNGELWVSQGTTGQSLARTADGLSWTGVQISGPSSAYAPPQIAYGNGVYVAAYGPEIHTSANGTTWVKRSPPAGASLGTNFAEANFIDGYFWIVDRIHAQAMRSQNGIEWTLIDRGVIPFEASRRVSVDRSLLAGNPVSSPTQAIKLTFSAATASATLSVSAFIASGTLSYQWQTSTDGGANWSAVSGATGTSLVLTGLTSADTGKRYRVVVSSANASPVTSTASTLTIT